MEPVWREIDGVAHRALECQIRQSACRLWFREAPDAASDTPRCVRCLEYRSGRERRIARRAKQRAAAPAIPPTQQARDEAYARETARRELERQARVARHEEERVQRAREVQAAREARTAVREDPEIRKAVRRMERAVERAFGQTARSAC